MLCHPDLEIKIHVVFKLWMPSSSQENSVPIGLASLFPIAIKIENCCEGSKQNNREYKITLIRLVNELILHKLLRHLTKCRWLSSNGFFLLLSSNNNSSTLFTLTMGIRKAIEYSYFFFPQPYTFFIITQFSRLSSFKTMEFFLQITIYCCRK